MGSSLRKSRPQKRLLEVTQDEIRQVAEEAAEKAVQKTLLAIGIDVSNPESIIRYQDNFGFLDALNGSVKAVKRQSIKTIVSVLFTAAVGYVLVVVGWNAVH